MEQQNAHIETNSLESIQHQIRYNDLLKQHVTYNNIKINNDVIRHSNILTNYNDGKTNLRLTKDTFKDCPYEFCKCLIQRLNIILPIPSSFIDLFYTTVTNFLRRLTTEERAFIDGDDCLVWLENKFEVELKCKSLRSRKAEYDEYMCGKYTFPHIDIAEDRIINPTHQQIMLFVLHGMSEFEHLVDLICIDLFLFYRKAFLGKKIWPHDIYNEDYENLISENE
ncbi:DhNV_010 [Dikerogammarus haemobaphes nudivirus]|nr:DhNV_010 [Dikerogammarus haemobaphes nudivirus]